MKLLLAAMLVSEVAMPNPDAFDLHCYGTQTRYEINEQTGRETVFATSPVDEVRKINVTEGFSCYEKCAWLSQLSAVDGNRITIRETPLRDGGERYLWQEYFDRSTRVLTTTRPHRVFGKLYRIQQRAVCEIKPYSPVPDNVLIDFRKAYGTGGRR